MEDSLDTIQEDILLPLKKEPSIKNKYELNRLLISGPITDETPICVIVEIALCFGCMLDNNKLSNINYINTIIKTIEKATIPDNIITVQEHENNPLVPHGFIKTDFSDIARFVNPDENIRWITGSVIYTFNNILKFYKKTPNIEELVKFEYGQITPEDPNNYNACMLYKICVFNCLKTNRFTKLSEMAQAIKFYNKPNDILKDNLNIIITHLHKNELVNLIMSNDLKVAQSPPVRNYQEKNKIKNRDSSINGYDFNKLNNAYNDLIDIDKLWLRLEPRTHEESIILAARIFFKNLTECSNPTAEFLGLKEYSNNTTSSNRYIPVEDYIFRKKFLINPSWYDIKKTWTPKIPNIYTKEHLEMFARAEGYEEELKNGKDPLEILSDSRCSPTFYLGEHPEVYILQKRHEKESAMTSIEFDDSMNVNRNLIVSYGIVQDSSFVLYKISELIDYFTFTNSFSDPQNSNIQFSTQSILKLKNIALSQTKNLRQENCHTDGGNEYSITSTSISSTHLAEDYITPSNESLHGTTYASNGSNTYGTNTYGATNPSSYATNNNLYTTNLSNTNPNTPNNPNTSNNSNTYGITNPTIPNNSTNNTIFNESNLSSNRNLSSYSNISNRNNSSSSTSRGGLSYNISRRGLSLTDLRNTRNSNNIRNPNEIINETLYSYMEDNSSSNSLTNPLTNPIIYPPSSIPPTNIFTSQEKHDILPQNEIETEYSKLLDIIEKIYLYNINLNKNDKELFNIFINSESETKILMKNLIINILHMGYYMRGWKAENDKLPIKESYYSTEFQYIVDTNSWNSMNEFNVNLEKLPVNIKKIFTSLPLMRAQKKDNKIVFIPSNSKVNGITVIDRINIVKAGEKEKNNTNSCIRMASNWFLHTGYYYSLVLKLDIPFNIKDMSEVS